MCKVVQSKHGANCAVYEQGIIKLEIVLFIAYRQEWSPVLCKALIRSCKLTPSLLASFRSFRSLVDALFTFSQRKSTQAYNTAHRDLIIIILSHPDLILQMHAGGYLYKEYLYKVITLPATCLGCWHLLGLFSQSQSTCPAGQLQGSQSSKPGEGIIQNYTKGFKSILPGVHMYKGVQGIAGYKQGFHISTGTTLF